MIKINNRDIQIKRKAKIFFPKKEISKKNIIDYYKKIAPIIHPHLKDRPINLLCIPEGVNQQSFYQKKIPKHYPSWLKATNIPLKQGGSQKQLLINDTETLIYLVSQGCITPHTWLSRHHRINYPDRLIFDIDPSKELDFKKVKKAAALIKTFLPIAFLMTTGGKGLHIIVPLDAKNDFDETREQAKKFAKNISNEYPKQFTANSRKEKRKGKIFIDYLRNSFGQTTAPPYSLRSKPGAPVATPIEWKELTNIESPKQYTLKNIFKRLSKKGDIWKEIDKNKISVKRIKL